MRGLGHQDVVARLSGLLLSIFPSPPPNLKILPLAKENHLPDNKGRESPLHKYTKLRSQMQF